MWITETMAADWTGCCAAGVWWSRVRMSRLSADNIIAHYF